MLTPGSASVDRNPFASTLAVPLSPGTAALGASGRAVPAARAATLSIVLLVHNQRATVRDLVSRLLRLDVGPLTRELIVVDEGSDDGTADVLTTLDGQQDVRTVSPPPSQTTSPNEAGRRPGRRRSTGEAVARGLRAATGDLVILHDGRLDIDPADYARLLTPVVEGKADVVYGSCYLGAPEARRVTPFWPWIGHRLSTLWANAFTGLNLTDLRPGLIILTREIVDRLELASTGPSVTAEIVCAEIVCKVTRLRARVWEAPITCEARPVGRWLAAALTILRFWRWEAPAGDVGAITLRRMARLQPYNLWLHQRFEHVLGQRVLEVGSGVGNQTCYFADRERVIASDIEPHYVRELTAAFGRRSNVRVASFKFPLSPDDRDDLRNESLDSIVCMNVLEHIDDDKATLADFAAVLEPGGRLVLLVPAHPACYGTLDVALRHFRRYDKAALAQLVADAGFVVDSIRHLNRPGAIGWWINSRLLKRRVLSSGQLRAFKWIMPLLALETRRPPSFGLSLLVLARRCPS